MRSSAYSVREDFNEILSLEDKWKGVVREQRQMMDFKMPYRNAILMIGL